MKTSTLDSSSSSAFHSYRERRRGQPVWIGVGLLLMMCCEGFAAESLSRFIETPLTVGKLFTPADWKPQDVRADLLVFFHGHPPVVCSNVVRSGKTVPIVVVNFNGLSTAYSTPFKDTNLFGRILTEARGKISQHAGNKIESGRLVVASFSAGYGAVREILKRPAYFEQIDGLVLADSLYAGYAEREGRKVVEPEHVKDFIRFAQRAAQGKAAMVVTISRQIPVGYASTSETAAELVRGAGAGRISTSRREGHGMVLVSMADAGGFHLRDYAGDGKEDHMNHLRNVGEALKLVWPPP
jgi:hypothetical protein